MDNKGRMDNKSKADNRKVLLVDDEVDFLDLVKLMLESKGYTVITAGSGEEALKKVRDEKPDAVMLDILMPGIDGLDVLKKIREHDKNLPVFMLTAFSNEERRSLANILDASGFILKTSDLQKEVQYVDIAIDIARKHKK